MVFQHPADSLGFQANFEKIPVWVLNFFILLWIQLYLSGSEGKTYYYYHWVQYNFRGRAQFFIAPGNGQIFARGLCLVWG